MNGIKWIDDVYEGEEGKENEWWRRSQFGLATPHTLAHFGRAGTEREGKGSLNFSILKMVDVLDLSELRTGESIRRYWWLWYLVVICSGWWWWWWDIRSLFGHLLFSPTIQFSFPPPFVDPRWWKSIWLPAPWLTTVAPPLFWTEWVRPWH